MFGKRKLETWRIVLNGVDVVHVVAERYRASAFDDFSRFYCGRNEIAAFKNGKIKYISRDREISCRADQQS